MIFKLLITLSVLFSFSLAVETEFDEYFISELNSGGMSKESYFDSLDLPNLYVGTECYKNCKTDCCYSVLKNENGKKLKSFSVGDSVATIARSRYKNKSYLYYSHSHGSGKNRTTDYYLKDNRLKSYEIPYGVNGAFDSAISKDADLLQIAYDGLYINGRLSLDSMNLESGVIENDFNGNIAVGAIEKESRQVYVSNLNKWVNSTIQLASHSDKEGVLTVYPDDKYVYLAAYNLVNIYNKGLMGAKVNIDDSSIKAGWIYNSQHQNIGFYPEMYLAEDAMYLNAKSSTTDKTVHFEITENEFNAIDKTSPIREGFENEDKIGFMIGTGVSYLAWSANSSASDKDDVDYADTEYEISNSLYKKVWLQGRIYDTQLAVSYMQNEAEKVGGLTKKASDVLNFFVDFNGLISESSALRVAYEKANVNGLTTFIDKNAGAINITPLSSPVEFESTLERFSLLVMQEKGFYGGFEYTTFQTPSAVGFSGSSKTMEYYGLDENFHIQNYELVFGYDTAAYAKRYETDFSKFFFQGLFGVGVCDYDMSSEFKSKLANQTSKTVASSSYSFVVDAEIEFGYIWQQRLKRAKGLGHSFNLGMKARGIYTGAGQSDKSDSSIEADELTMEMSRYDIWYGPYINYNIIF